MQAQNIMRTLLSILLAICWAESCRLTADILYSVSDLGVLNTKGYGINNTGQITGDSAGRAFLYSNGQITNLGTLGGTSLGEFSAGYSINDAGQITGDSSTTSYGVDHAFLYSNGRLTDLGTLGGAYSRGNSINNAGQIAGQSTTSAGGFHAFLYSNAQMTDLGTLGSDTSYGLGINNAGQVTGFSYTSTDPYSPHAFVYSSGQMFDLNSLIDPALHLTLEEANAINDNGQIVANAHNCSQTGCVYQTYLLTPVPEPSTLALFGAALFSSAVWVQRRRNLPRTGPA